jgi:hypothetical protein
MAKAFEVCPDGNERRSEPSGRVRCVADLSAKV